MRFRCWQYGLGVAACLGVVLGLYWFLHPEAAAPEPVAQPPQDLIIVYTTDTRGYLQSCGCVAQQVGGLAKRATLLRSLRAQAFSPVLFLEGGNLGENLAQAQVVLDFLNSLSYQVIGLGDSDCRLGARFFYEAARRQLPLTACPVPPESACTEVLPYRVCQVSGRHLVVASLLPSCAEQDFRALRSALEEELERTDLVFLFSGLNGAAEHRLQALAEWSRTPAVVVISRQRRSASRVGNLMWLPACQKGEVGWVHLRWRASSFPEIHHRQLIVSADEEPDPQVQARVQAYYVQQAQELLRASASLTQEVAAVGGYRPAQQCVDCHASQVSAWLQSRHAQAVQTLQERERLVPECLRCHSEFYRRTKGYNPQVVSAGNGVECASCHGDGLLHVALQDKRSIRRLVSAATCQSCHDPANDPGFDYGRYREKIRHW